MPEVFPTCSGSRTTEQFNPILFFWRNLSEPSETSFEETFAFFIVFQNFDEILGQGQDFLKAVSLNSCP